MKQVLILIALLFMADIAFAARFLPKAFEANIEQVHISGIRKKKVTVPVQIKYLFPNNIYYNVQGKSPVLYICNKTTTWKYNPPFIKGSKGECSVGSSSKYCYVKIFDALSNGLKSNKLYAVTLAEKKANLVFTEKASAQLSIKNVEILFKEKAIQKLVAKDIESMKIFYLNKTKPVTFIFKSIVENKALVEKDFVFDIPKNTNTNKFY